MPKAATAEDLLKEELGAIKVRKAKGAKNVTSGYANVLASFNNTIVSITDLKGQVIAWSMEAVRRGPGGIVISRGLLAALAAGAGLVQLTGHTTKVLDQVPTVWFFAGATSGALSWRLWETFLVLVVGTVVAVVVGAGPAHVAAKRMPRDEARMETDQHEPRPMARTVLIERLK